MKNNLKTLYSMPYVMGVCLGNNLKIESQMVKDESCIKDFSEVFKIFQSVFQFSLKHFQDASDISLSYKESVLYGIMIDEGLLLLAAIKPGTLKEKFINDVKDTAEKLINLPSEKFSEKNQKEIKRHIEIDELTISSAKKALVKAMGPIGEFVVDGVKNTIISGNEEFSEIDFLNCIAKEIDDADLYENFAKYYVQGIK